MYPLDRINILSPMSRLLIQNNQIVQLEKDIILELIINKMKYEEDCNGFSSERKYQIVIKNISNVQLLSIEHQCEHCEMSYILTLKCVNAENDNQLNINLLFNYDHTFKMNHNYTDLVEFINILNACCANQFHFRIPQCVDIDDSYINRQIHWVIDEYHKTASIYISCLGDVDVNKETNFITCNHTKIFNFKNIDK